MEMNGKIHVTSSLGQESLAAPIGYEDRFILTGSECCGEENILSEPDCSVF
jgi:hypothetical protein